MGLFLIGLGGACHPDETGRASSGVNVELGGGSAARVGGTSIPLSVVREVASAQNLSPREATRRLIDDQIAASAAQSRGLDQREPAAWRMKSARARLLADRLFVDAKRGGLPTDREVAELTARHWAAVDRPPSVRVIHAIVRTPKDASRWSEARSLAKSLRDAVVSAASEKDFEDRARAVHCPAPLEVRVETLPPFTEDGWVTEGPGRMDGEFAKGAFALRAPGDTSSILETSFGWHVVRLLESIPERRMPIEARRLAFTEEAYTIRSRGSIEALLSSLKAKHPTVISGSSAKLMESIVITGMGPTAAALP